MNLDEYLVQELNISKKKAYEIAGVVDKYNKTKGREKKE